MLGYLAAPVTYVGIVQAALCQRLGAGISIANLPLSTYLLGSFVPLLLSWLAPPRREREVLAWAHALAAFLFLAVGVSLVAPISNRSRITIVVAQSLLFGFTASVQTVYRYQCLGRSTKEAQRISAIKLAYTLGPLAAIAGALGAETVLKRAPGTSLTPFAALYIFGALCMTAAAFASLGFRPEPLAGGPKRDFAAYSRGAVASLRRRGPLLYLLFGYALWYSALSSLPDLSMNVRNAMGRDQSLLVGAIFSLRFGAKAVAGYAVGEIAQKLGIRSALLALVGLQVAALTGGCFLHGSAYLSVFALMGAAELGGAYFPNYCLTLSAPEDSARNLSVLNLATLAASASAAAQGEIALRLGFQASFVLAGACALASLVVVGFPTEKRVSGFKV